MKRISKVLSTGSVFMIKLATKLALIAAFVGMNAQAFENKRPKVIYGKDDRLDVFQVSDPALLAVADATAAMIPKEALGVFNQSMVSIQGKIFGEEFGLCKNEPFYSQPNPAMCSVFLVAPDMIATAGHCVSEIDCDANAFVFNYKMNGPGVNPTSVSAEDVYTCKRVVSRELTREQDYALVQLDRPVTGHTPLVLAQSQVKRGTNLVMIGHPSGLPTKIAGGASVRKLEKGFFVANTDSYGGNSGSAVLDATTNEVVGILVRGEEDFKYDNLNQCTRSNYCADDACRGEDVTHIEYIVNSLKTIQ